MRTIIPAHELVVGIAVALLLSTDSSEGGQGSDLFGPTPETTSPVSSVGVSVYGGAGDAAGLSAVGGDPLVESPFYAGFYGGLGHRRRGSGHDFVAAVGTSYRYFPETRELLNLEGSGSASVGTEVGKRGRLTLRQTAQYTRFRQLNLAPVSAPVAGSVDDLPTSNPEGSATVGEPFYDLTSGVTFAQSLGSRSSFSADYQYRINLNNEYAERPTSHETRVRYQTGATRRTSVSLGTGYRTGRTGWEAGTARIYAYDVDGGIGYTRRKTTFNASTGITLVSRGDVPTPDGAGGSDYAVVGSAGVTRQVGGSWSFAADYSRRLQFVDAFPDPFAADQANGLLTGQLGRRINVSARASYWNGTAISTTASSDQRADGWQATVSMGLGVTRWSQGYVLYTYTANDFSAGALASLSPGVRPRSQWGGVRAGLTMWAAHIH